MWPKFYNTQHRFLNVGTDPRIARCCVDSHATAVCVLLQVYGAKDPFSPGRTGAENQRMSKVQPPTGNQPNNPLAMMWMAVKGWREDITRVFCETWPRWRWESVSFLGLGQRSRALIKNRYHSFEFFSDHGIKNFTVAPLFSRVVNQCERRSMIYPRKCCIQITCILSTSTLLWDHKPNSVFVASTLYCTDGIFFTEIFWEQKMRLNGKDKIPACTCGVLDNIISRSCAIPRLSR